MEIKIKLQLQSVLKVVASGFSERQLMTVGYSVANFAIQKGAQKFRQRKTKPVLIEEGWVTVDCKDVMVHLMTLQVREKEEWESHFAHERVPEEHLDNPLAFKPKMIPEPSIAWYDEVKSEAEVAEESNAR